MCRLRAHRTSAALIEAPDSELRPLAEAARRAHVSEAAFSRFFRRETGRTWTEAVNELRCSEAARRLRQDTRPVAEIAADCGWRMQSHFNRVFRAPFGMTPRAWRRAAG